MRNWEKAIERERQRRFQETLSSDSVVSRLGRGYDYAHKGEEGYTSLSDRWNDLYKRAVDYYNNEAHTGFYNTYSGTRNKKGYVSDTGAWYSDLEGMRDSANEGVDELLAELDQYSRYYNPDAVSYVRDLITKRKSSYDEVLKDAGVFRDHWSQWATEDDYNNAVWENDFYKLIQDGKYDEAEASLKSKAEDFFKANPVDVPNISSNEDPGEYTREYIQKARKLVEYEEYIKQTREYSEYKPFWDALETGDFDAAEAFLNEKAQTKTEELKDNPYVAFLYKAAETKDKIEDGIANFFGYDTEDNSKEYIPSSVLAYWNTLEEYKQNAGYDAYDDVAGEEALDALKKSVSKADMPLLMKGLNKLYNFVTLGLDKDGAPFADRMENYEDLLAEYQDKKKFHDNATAYKALNNMVEGAITADDFEFYANQGLTLENPSAMDWYSNGQPIKNIATFYRDNGAQLEILAHSFEIDPKYAHMTEDEVKIYSYYLAKHGETKAQEYLNAIDDELVQREKDAQMSDFEKMADRLPILSSVVSVGTSLGSAVEYVGDTAQYGFDWLKDSYDAQMDKNSLAETTNVIRGAVADKYDLNILGWDAFDFVYNTTMSGVDSFAASVIPGGGVVLGLSAAAQGINDALARGLSSEQAFWTGAMQGVFEGLFESVSIGKFKSLQEAVTVGGRDVAMNIAKSMLVNASEEACTEVANILFDTMMNGALANYTWEELENGAWWDALGQVVESAASGALMGAGFGGIGSAISHKNTKTEGAKYAANPSELIATALKLAPDNKYAQSLKAKLEGGKEISQAELGKLSFELQEGVQNRLSERDASARQQFTTELDKKLSSGIEDKQLRSQMADTMTRIAYGEHVSNAELRKISQNQKALNVLEKVIGTRYKAGEVTVSELRKTISSRQDSTARLSSANILSTYAAHFDMDEATERSLMVSYATDTKNAADGKAIAPEQYAALYHAVYVAGKKGNDISKISGEINSILSESTIAQAYRAGENARAAENSQKDLSNGSDSGKINTVNKEAQNEQQQDGVHIRNGSEWNDGQNPGGQVSDVEGNARQNKGRGEGRTGSRDSEASSLSYDREVSAKELVKGGLESSRVWLPTEGSETASMKEARKIAESRGLKVVFFGGGNLKVLEGTKIISARAYIQGDTVYVRVDHAGFAADQLMKHEAAHDMIDKGEINVADVKKLISERFTPEEIDAVINSYAIAYENAGMTADEIWEEVICDSVAEMNSFEGTDFTAAAEMAADFLPDLKEAVLESKKESRGPPAKNVEGKASRETRRAKYIDINRSTHEAIESQLRDLYGNVKSGVATEIAIPIGKDVYIVDSGKENGKISFGIRKIITISNESLRNEYIRRQNNDAVSNGYVSDGLSSRFRSENDSHRRGNKRQEFGEKLSVDQGKSADNKKGIFEENADKRGVKGKASREIRVNSRGRDLSNEQIEYFEKSKVRDTDGNLLVMYHGTNVNRRFFKFNTQRPAWFTAAPGYANAFTPGDGKKAVYEVYLNVTNPLYLGNIDGIANEENLKHFSALSKIDVSTLQEILSEEKGEHLWKITNSAKFKNLVQKNGYDGLVAREGGVTSWAIFGPEQAKDIKNPYPSTDADIRFSLDLEFFDFLNENAETAEVAEDSKNSEPTNREILANALESVAETDRDKSILNRYKDHLAKIENNRAEIERLKEERRKAEKAKQKKAISQKIEKLQSEIDYSEKRLITLEDTATLKYLVSKERKARQAEAHLAGQMAQGRRDAEILRHANERLDKQKNAYNEKLAEQQRLAREALDKQAKRYQESRKKSVEGRHKTEMHHKIQSVVSELDKLLRKGNKKSNVKLGLQDAVAAALEAFDTNAEKVARYKRDMARLDEKIAAATDPMEIEALMALREKKQRNSELLADKLLVMKKAYEDIHNNAGDENYPAYYRAEAKVILDRIADVVEKVGDVPISEMSLSQLETVYDMYRMVLTTVRDANKAFINGKLEDLSENAADMTAELQKIKKLPEERLRAGDDARGFVWNELTPYYAFKRIGSETLMRYYDELVRGQDVYARDLDEAKKFAEGLRKKYKSKAWNRNKIVTFKDRDGREFRLNLGQMMSIYAYSKREQAFDHMEKGGFFFNNKETFRKKGGVLEFIASNESGYKVDASVFAQIKAALTPEQIAYVDEMQAYLTKMGEKGNEVTRQMWGIDIFKEKVYFPLKSKEDFIYQANTPAETSSLKNDGMTKETKPHASNPIVLESFDEVWANHVEKMSKYHGFVIPIDNLNKLINYGSWMESKKITPEMSDAERYSILKDKVIKNVPKAGSLKPGTESGISNWGDIDKLMGKEKREVIHKVASEFGVFKGYENKDIEISFDFSNNNFRETYSKQGKRYTQFAKLFSVFDQVIENAIGIEAHNRNNAGYKPDPTLKNFYVLMSAFEDGDSIIPVKLEVKEFNDKQNTLYVAITMNAIEKAEVWKSGSSNTDVAPNSRSANISISQIFAKINTSDQNFLKYVPDGFLNPEQIEAKKQALEKDGVKYSPSSAGDLSGSEMGSHSISTMLEARYSSAVNDYLNTFIKDLNGAKAQNGGWLGIMSNWLTKFKKTAVAASLSVVVQQPTAILRATSEIDARYFAHLPKVESLNKKWERIQTYAPIAIIKDIGGFDAGSGKQITEWLNSDTRQGINKAMNKLDDVTMYGAALGDRVGWGAIWTAVEREVQVKQNLKYGTEEFWQACGKRFTDVIVKTQVYDSTISRSGFMRGKDGLLKMATAFMGEPTLSVNMLADTFLQAKRGTIKKRQVARTVAAVVTATIAASIFKSLIYALRDDDEDESYAEKYMQAFGGSILNDINPLSMLPFYRDVVSVFDGWSADRADMAIVQDLYNAITALDSENKTTWRKFEDLAGALGALAGVPAKNFLRTLREMNNAINDIVDGIEGGDLGGAFIEGVTGKDKNKSQTLYEALIGGEKERINAIRKNYKSDEEYMEAVRKALRSYDPRIKKAAQALYMGDLLTRNEIMLEIMGEGVFDMETLDRAIDAELQAIKDAENDQSEEEKDSAWNSVYSPSDIALAFDHCSDELALEIIAELSEIKIDEKVAAAKANAEAKGKKFDEAEAREDAEDSVKSTFRSSLTKHYKPLYQAAYASGDREEMQRIKNILKTSGLYVFKTNRDVDDVLDEWIEEE